MLLEIEPGLMIWTIVTFVVLLVVLRAVAWKPLLAMLAEREQRIQESLDQAERAKADAQTAVEENRQAMAKARVDAQETVARGREAAERLAQDVRQRAEVQAEQMIEQASRTIQQEKDQAISELRRQVADLAIQAAGKVLDENLDDARNRKLVDEYIDRIPDSNSN